MISFIHYLRVRADLIQVGILLCGLLMAACQAEQPVPHTKDGVGKEDVPLRDINLVLADHDDDLLKLASVVGVAVGELDDHTPCLIIMLSEENHATREQIPAYIEGHPTKIVVSGDIRPL